ncbi:MAG: DUF4124 domain-containing protein [Acidovorax sp.]|nr:DUF4124 domain-containing protein [Acidovorax sp.]
MKMHRFFFAAAACWVSLNAFAQWQWIDKDGRKVFSDRPPPQDIPDKSILKQPGARQAPPLATAPAASAAPADAAASPPANAPRASGKDKELEEKKAQAQAEEAAQKKAEEERVAKVRAENCARARQAKIAIEPGRLVSQVNAKGERVFLDDAARAAEGKRIDAVIASDCGPR